MCHTLLVIRITPVSRIVPIHHRDGFSTVFDGLAMFSVDYRGQVLVIGPSLDSCSVITELVSILVRLVSADSPYALPHKCL